MSIPVESASAALATHDDLGRRPSSVWARRLLITSPIGFVAVVAATVVALTVTGVGDLSEATSREFSAALIALVLRNVVYVVATCWGTIGVLLAARWIVTTGERGHLLAFGAQLASGLAMAAALATLVVPWIAAGFTEPTFGDTTIYGAFFAASALTILCSIAAAALVALAVRATGLRRTYMLVLAVVCVVYFVVDVTTRGGIPPFAIAFVWLALGIGLRPPRVPA